MIVFTPNTVIKSADANLNFADSILSKNFTNNYMFSVYRNSAWTAGNNAYAKITFDTEVFDTNNNFASGTYTVPQTGYYQLNAAASVNTVTGGGTIIALYKNGSYFMQGRSGVEGSGYSGAFQTSSTFASLVYATSGTTFDIYQYGNNQTGGTGQDKTYFNGYFVSL